MTAEYRTLDSGKESGQDYFDNFAVWGIFSSAAFFDNCFQKFRCATRELATMRFLRPRPVMVVWVILATAFIAGAKFAAEPPMPPPVSSFAPADDLLKQIDYYKERLQTALANEAEFDEAKQARVVKDAGLMAVLAMHLGMHDMENPLKKSAGAIVKQARALATAKDYKSASEKFHELEAALAGKAPAEELKWGKVAGLGNTMKQVSVINAALKRGLQPSRLKSQAKKTTGETATLAAIANSLLFDTHEVKNEADLAEWYAYSAEFRGSAAALNAAIKTGQIAKVSPALKRMSASCDTCHKKFHQQELPQAVVD
jgi:cytochrome c556